MVKSIIKEIFIILLLIIAIVLVLGIIFYEYRPSTKKIPTAVSEYVLPEEMQEELKETLEAAGAQNIIKTYRVDGDDLKSYQRSNDYEQGRVHPFEGIKNQEQPNQTDTSTGNNNNNGNNSNTNETPQDGTNTQGGFLNTVK